MCMCVIKCCHTRLVETFICSYARYLSDINSSYWRADDENYLECQSNLKGLF